MGQFVEDPFAKLLDNKILNKRNTISLTRSELYLVKQYLLLDSIKTMGEEGFVKIIKGFTSNAKRYALFSEEAKKLPLLENLNMDNHDIYMRAINYTLTVKLPWKCYITLILHWNFIAGLCHF